MLTTSVAALELGAVRDLTKDDYRGDSLRGKNPKAVAEVLAGKRSTGNAAWWGFDQKDSTRSIQAAINS